MLMCTCIRKQPSSRGCLLHTIVVHSQVGIWTMWLGKILCFCHDMDPLVSIYLCFSATKAWFTPWTMKSDHGGWHFHGPTSTVRFLEKTIYKAFGPLTRCKPNVDQEEWPRTKKRVCWFFEYMPKKWQFWKTFKFHHTLVFIFSSPKLKFIINLL